MLTRLWAQVIGSFGRKVVLEQAVVVSKTSLQRALRETFQLTYASAWIASVGTKCCIKYLAGVFQVNSKSSSRIVERANPGLKEME